ncbi:MFS transporter [Streptomyces sp. ID05-26A]|nr:MFS transporter [Streptomyces sp. ID05-26A]
MSHQRKVVANVVRGCLGNLVEWYDWFVYASFSIYFAAAFFPRGNLTAQLLSTAVVFAVGFLIRPLGGWLLGLYADRHGRRAALTLSVTLMSLGSMAIALTPDYATIGVLAPVILVLARLLQGLSVGGEFGSSATYLAEIATPGRRGFYSSFQYVSIILGQLGALLTMILLQSVLNEDQISAWGWRVPFAVGAVAGLVVLYLRRSMDESEHFSRQEAHRGGLRTLVTEHPRQLIAVLGLAIGGTVTFYTFTSYSQKYMVNTSGIPRTTVAVIGFAALAVFMLLQPMAGALSDRVGRRPVMLGFSISGLLLTVPILTALGRTTNPWLAFGLLVLALVFLSGYTALAAVIKAEMFPTNVRALGVGLPHAVVAATFGGLSEPIALALKQAGHENVYFWWVSGCIGLTLVATLLVREPSRNSTLDRSGSGEVPDMISTTRP